MPDWFVAPGGRQEGPLTEADVVERIRRGGLPADTLVFTTGMDGWRPAHECAPLADHFPGRSGTAAPPPLPGRRAHDIEYRIEGEDLQFVEVHLDPGESVVAEAGGLMYMTGGIEMETIFGDGSEATGSGGGLMGALLGAGERLLTGESLFMTTFTNRAAGLERVAFAAPFPGRIVPLDLAALGGEIICQKDSFLCAARGTTIGIAFQKKIGVGLFGGEGFIMQRLQGDGLCFAHAGGMVTGLDLGPGETLRVDTGCIVALVPSVSYDVQLVGKIKTALFGGEGLFFATILCNLELHIDIGALDKAGPGNTPAGRLV